MIRRLGGSEPVTRLVECPPPWSELPTGRQFSPEFLDLRAAARDWLAGYHDRDHLIRSADWLLALEPGAPEYLVLAAMTHDLERAIPGGPVLDKAHTPWDDLVYNTAHCERSADVVSRWLVERGAPEGWAQAVRRPIREHEFGGSPEGDLMQAADSISFLETDGDLVAAWVTSRECTLEKGREKLRWMCDRVRLPRAVEPAIVYFARAMGRLEARVAG